jgi:oxygen-independent coproporphyrinogen III oxidase
MPFANVPSNEISLYFHIPFCEKKCVYCDFYSIENRSSQQEFVRTLLHEVDLKLRAHPELAGRTVNTIFFGGGTPSLLSVAELAAIVAKVREYFKIDDETEFTLECNPGTVTEDNLLGYHKLGVNRLSYGVQSFHHDELEFLSRIHSADDARNAVQLSRKAGFSNINIDLMFALPKQTLSKLTYSLDEAFKLETEHISAYNLIVEEGTPLNRMVRLGQVGEMASDDAAELFAYVQERMLQEGYGQYEISNYARHPALRCKHNLVYWDGFSDYVSFGPSAHEFVGGTRAWNVSSLERYVESIEQNRLPYINSETLSLNERRTEVLYCQLRALGIDLIEFKEIFNEDLLLDPIVGDLLEEEVVRVANDMLSLTQKGYRYCDAIVVRLMRQNIPV